MLPGFPTVVGHQTQAVTVVLGALCDRRVSLLAWVQVRGPWQAPLGVRHSGYIGLAF